MAMRRPLGGLAPICMAFAALSLAGCANREAVPAARYGSIKDTMDRPTPVVAKDPVQRERPVIKAAIKAEDMRSPSMTKVDRPIEPIKSPLAAPSPVETQVAAAPRPPEAAATVKPQQAPPPVNVRPPQPKPEVASAAPLQPSSPSALGVSGEKKTSVSALDTGSPTTQIEQAELLLRIGNIKGARDALAAGVKAKNADSIAALGRTFDPIELEKFLVPAGTTDAAKAATLYEEAAALGSTVAKTRLEKLKGALVLPAQKK